MIRFRKAILIIHGFTGNLYDNEYLMNYLEYNPWFDVYAKTLPGHNKDRFSKAKYTDWIDFVDSEIQNLINCGYHSIYIIGHSMGGILASYVASKYLEVKKLVLINAAFDYLNFNQNKLDILDNHDFSKYSHLLEKALRTSPMILLEFTKFVKAYKNVINDVSCDTLVLRSLSDEIIPYETADYIYIGLKSKKKYLTNIKDCGHVALTSNKKEIISQYIEMFLIGGYKWKKNKKNEL